MRRTLLGQSDNHVETIFRLIKPLQGRPSLFSSRNLEFSYSACQISSPQPQFSTSHGLRTHLQRSKSSRFTSSELTRRTFSNMSTSNSWWKGSHKSGGSESQASLVQSKPMNAPEILDTEVEHLLTRRIHILGLGSIGRLVAHSLRCLPNPPPITLLFKPSQYERFKENGRIIRLINASTEINDEQSGYDVDLSETDEETGRPYWRFIPDRSENRNIEPNDVLQPGEALESGEVYIHTLIVTVKGPGTVSALRSVKHRINSQSTVCLIQNGMGQVDELNKEVFIDPETRPTYMLGIISHGAHLSTGFSVVHAGLGTTALGIYRDTDKYPLPPKSSNTDVAQLSQEDRKRMYPTDEELFSNLSSRYLLRTLTRSTVLACAPYPYLDLFQTQLEKLVMNCVLNPITALLNVPDGSLLNNRSIARAQRLLLAEISLVIRGLPELEGVPGVQRRFSTERLEGLCDNIAEKTAQNSSSMREDVRNLKDTEINYINGYMVRRGEEQGIKCVLNYMMVMLIKGKTTATMGNEAADVKPYGVSSVEGEQDAGSESGNAVTLEDTGTQLKGKPY